MHASSLCVCTCVCVYPLLYAMCLRMRRRTSYSLCTTLSQTRMLGSARICSNSRPHMHPCERRWRGCGHSSAKVRADTPSCPLYILLSSTELRSELLSRCRCAHIFFHPFPFEHACIYALSFFSGITPITLRFPVITQMFSHKAHMVSLARVRGTRRLVGNAPSTKTDASLRRHTARAH